MSRTPNTLREAWGQALTLTLGTLRFHLSSARKRTAGSSRMWTTLAVVVVMTAAVANPYATGYALGKFVLPMVAVLLLIRVAIWVRHTVAKLNRL